MPELVVEEPEYGGEIYIWRDDEAAVMMIFGDDVGGNLSYEYIPGGDTFRNASHDLAGAIRYERYMTINENFEVVEMYDEELSAWAFQDRNGNYQIDEGGTDRSVALLLGR